MFDVIPNKTETCADAEKAKTTIRIIVERSKLQNFNDLKIKLQ